MGFMGMEQISPDQVVFWQWGVLKVNATMVFTWLVMAMLVVGSHLATRKMTFGAKMPKRQHLIEWVTQAIRGQIREISGQDPDRYLVFTGTLFLFIGMANLLTIFPGYLAPTGSLSTTAALAGLVFFAVPVHGVASRGLLGYLKQYVRPTALMLPFNLIGELSRTLAMAVRLFGNVMSAAKVAAILLAVVPLFFPIVLRALGLLTGMVQAYIFGVLAIVYISSATRTPGDEQGAG